MREIDSGRSIGEVARQLELSPHLLDRWRGEWRARGDLAFPGIGRGGVAPVFTELQRIAELERKIGQLTMETDFQKKPCSISGIITRITSTSPRKDFSSNGDYPLNFLSHWKGSPQGIMTKLSWELPKTLPSDFAMPITW